MSSGPSLGVLANFRSHAAIAMATISVGHGVKHWYLAAFAVFLPLIEEEFALSALGVSALVTIRQFGVGAPNLFVGYLADRFRRHWALLLPVSLLGTAGAYALAGITPWFWGIALLVALAGASASIWHPPAISMLSLRFPARRGMAIAFHGAGSGAGEAFGPLGVGLILAAVLMDDWRLYVVWALAPAALCAGVLYWLLLGVYQPTPAESRSVVRPMDLFRMLRGPAFSVLAYANFTRGFAHFGLLAFLPLYLARDLGMDSAGVGSHVALLTLLGVAAGPIFGYISDRVGRRVLIVVAFAGIGLGLLAMGLSGAGVPLVIALGATGVFLWSVQDVINASAMDAAPRGREGTTVGLMFASGFVGGVLGPLVAGLVVTVTGERVAVFYMAGAVMVPALLLLAVAPLRSIRV